VGILARYGARLVLLMSVTQHTLTSLTPISHLNPAVHAIKVEWVRGVVLGEPRIVASFRSSIIPTTALKPLKLGLSVRGCCCYRRKSELVFHPLLAKGRSIWELQVKLVELLIGFLIHPT